MTVHQHAAEVRAFARYLRELAALLDPGRGWYGVFRARDPEGMSACFDGTEVPPWDVVESLLHDLASVRGTAFAARESAQAAALYAASASAHDRRPGGRQALVDRLGVMLREQSYAAGRMRAAGADAERAPDGGTEALAWARDDHARATARCAELRGRLAAMERAEPDDRLQGRRDARAPETGGDSRVPGSRRADASTADAPHLDPGAGTAHAAGTAPAPAKKRGKPRGARFAGLELDDDTEVSPAPPAVAGLPAPSPTPTVPRGARFGAARASEETGVPRAPGPAAPGPASCQAAEDTVVLLVRLRAEGRSGEAHAVLCEAAGRPAEDLPVLAVALSGAGLHADWATLLWEVSSLPPAELAAAAGALAAAGRGDDCRQLLRQGVARPADEIAEAVAALDRAGLAPEARALLGAFVRVRTPQEAARIAAGGPRHLVPQLLAAAREVSVARERDLVHALRSAGIGAP
ncbi:hypothetical protein [Streptomyces atroolivaceus]|uniref:UL36 very large tegument protein n=1 Tax=Streptomyces atroolivaceus TaxID=66869 RepID=A0ABV9VHG2_STRAZ|nr:hypothetical protein [Streptomyces atroolivaceus]